MKRGKKKCALGGKLTDLNNINFAGIGTNLGNIVDSATLDEEGKKTNESAAISGALRGAGAGASIGSIVPGIGTAIGGGVGALIGGISSVANNKKQLEALAVEELKREEEKTKLINQQYQIANANYDRGSKQVTMFKKGGKLPLEIIGMGSVKVKGKTHEEGGVNLGVAEVEKDEIIHKDKVYSNRLKVPGSDYTYAQKAQKIIGKPKYKTLSEEMTGPNLIKMDTYKAGTMIRNLQKVEKPLNDLFDMQERSKRLSNPKMKALGGSLYEDPIPVKGAKLFRKYLKNNEGNLNKANKALDSLNNYLNMPGKAVYNSNKNNTIAITEPLNNEVAIERNLDNKIQKNNPNLSFTGRNYKGILDNVVPYADNLVNAFLTQNSPVVPTPLLNTAPKLKTNFNVDPQLAEIAKSEVGTKRSILDNVSDGASARGALLSNRFSTISARNNVLSQKENIETDLKNKQAMLTTDVLNRNRDIINNNNLMKFQRRDDIASRISQNATNATEDLGQQVVDRKLDQRDELSLAMLMKKYKGSGVLNRMDIPKIRSLISKGYSADEAIQIVAEGTSPVK